MNSARRVCCFAIGQIWVHRLSGPRYVHSIEPMVDNKPSRMNAGVGVALGAGIGAALFAATSSPVWIAIGAAIGAALGTTSELIDKAESEDDAYD